nr:TBC1 domain family member 20-like [Anolis sagrei ordinatus]
MATDLGATVGELLSSSPTPKKFRRRRAGYLDQRWKRHHDMHRISDERPEQTILLAEGASGALQSTGLTAGQDRLTVASGGPEAPDMNRCMEVRQNHKDYNQVLLDVRRSVRRFPPGMPEAQRQVLQEQLTDAILHVLRSHPELHYYQGYHDIAVTLLLVAGQRMAMALLERLSLLHLRDFMDPTMDSTKHILNYLMPILQRERPRLHDFMHRAEVGTIFALSWLITWYSHVLANVHHTLRLYDFFLASHPLMAVYFAAAIVLHREEDVLACECDMPSLHQLLSRIPQDLPYETLVLRAQGLFRRHPHTELAKQAALQAHKSISIGSFLEFQQAASCQRPDTILLRQQQQRRTSNPRPESLLSTTEHSPLVKAAVWGISATLGAAALAVTQTALEWGPEFLLQLF